MRILVTGASGFIGGVLCRRLVEEGHEVAGLVRRVGTEPPRTVAVRGDLSDAASLRAALRDSAPDCVVHLAAQIASQRNGSRVMAVNVGGTESLVDACLQLAGEAGPGPRLVFASTVVTGEARGALLKEDEPLPVATPYGRSKQEGERIVLSSGLPAVVVRPCHVYGPGGWYAQEIVPRLRQPGRFAVVGDGANMWDVVHVEDVAAALSLACTKAPAGETYHVADDDPLTYGEFMSLTAQALGVGAPRRIPVFVARLVAGRNAVDAVTRSARTSNEKIKRELGWSPRYASAREGVPAAVAALEP